MKRETKDRKNARQDFLQMVTNSWTWDRMTPEERQRFIDTLYAGTGAPAENGLIGSYIQRWRTLQAYYSFFLAGLGYTGPRWREPEDAEPTPLF